MSRTGGPEALHQLSDMLISLNINALILYTKEEDLIFMQQLSCSDISQVMLKIENRDVIPDEYLHYKAKILSELVTSDDTVFIIPESQLHWAPIFLHQKVVIWWLSVENFFGSFAKSGLNINYLRLANIIHAYQSIYAKNFLLSLGFNQIQKLSDYTPVISKKSEVKSIISLSATNKVIFDTKKIALAIEDITGLKTLFINGLGREEVYKTFSMSYCYIDLGSFPGKDRMAREASLLNCIPIVLNVGGASDYNLPDALKFELNEIQAVPFAVKNIVDNYDIFLNNLFSFKQEVRNEKLIFMKEVSMLVEEIKIKLGHIKKSQASV